MYAVLTQRRGRIVKEEMVEGTDTFLVDALLPVVSSFGFAKDMRRKTSGACPDTLANTHTH